jgi:membrane-bound lytic murein transglycosylase A
LKNYFIIFVVLLAVSCSKANVKHVPQPKISDCDCTQQTPPPAEQTKPVITQDYALLKPAQWEDIDGFSEDDMSAAWPAWLQSCSTLINRTSKNKMQNNQSSWQTACSAANALGETNNPPSKQAILTYFAQHFNVYSTVNEDGSDVGLITGYYEPLLKGSRTKSSQYPHPLYKQPADLITVDLGEAYPELKNKRVRGKLKGNKLVPYPTRAEIETIPSPLVGNELVWINDLVDGFFLQVQGSGLVQLDNGESMHVGYADQNGQTYNSIGRVLIERGELTIDQAGMQGIKEWARNNPQKLRDLLNANPSYVFFRELPAGLSGPLGALGVPLTAGRSVAIDPKHVPLGAPIFLSTTLPNSNKPLKKLMVAQDTGGAIKGGVRADYFWGAGESAGKQAGSMKQLGKIWVLLPKDFKLPDQRDRQ